MNPERFLFFKRGWITAFFNAIDNNLIKDECQTFMSTSPVPPGLENPSQGKDQVGKQMALHSKESSLHPGHTNWQDYQKKLDQQAPWSLTMALTMSGLRCNRCKLILSANWSQQEPGHSSFLPSALPIVSMGHRQRPLDLLLFQPLWSCFSF